MIRLIPRRIATAASAALIGVSSVAAAAPPTRENVDTYAALCKIGDSVRYELGAKVLAPLAAIARRVLIGEARLTVTEITDQFPEIRNEKNRLAALQAYQDCMYRYVERWHSAEDGHAGPAPRPAAPSPTATIPGTPLPRPDPARTVQGSPSVVAPSVPLERRREIVFLANQLDDFKEKMKKVVAALPQTYYDRGTSTERRPRDDTRVINLDNYSRYKAFQTATGVPDFSDMSNNDIAILCDTYRGEVTDYTRFRNEYWRVFALQPYEIPGEAARICQAARKGR